MMDNALQTLANQALSAWGGGTLTLIGQRENVVFRADLTDGTIVALRLHRRGYQTSTHINGELIWTAALADEGFPCPRPVASKSGDLLVHLPNTQIATAVSWIDAKPIGAHGLDFAGNPQDHTDLYFQIGKLTRQLHLLTDTLDQTIFRPAWNIDGLLGPQPLWDKFWKNPSLTPSEIDRVQSARQQARQHLQTLTSPDIGLIHADIMQENILRSDTGLHLIDFDDSGIGYRLFDLGTALIQHTTCAYKGDLKSALCSGYGTPEDDILLFIMLRSMASAGWIISRAKADDPKQRVYADRMLRCIADYGAT